ncbi:MAG: hypothetical protein MUD11_13825 [Rhodobacteraceae bacterium]|nr:hypothetical protein [Paracoccaceae bacterium]
MAVNYDFDIEWPSANAGAAGAATSLALFRDADTLAELLRAPVAVRDWLTGAGFGLTLSHGGHLPPGHYAAHDEVARIDHLQRLSVTMKDHDLPRGHHAQGWSGFVIADFVTAVAAAQPLREVIPVAPEKPVVPIPSPFGRLRGAAARAALAAAAAAPRGWQPLRQGTPFAVDAFARRLAFLRLTLGIAFVYCAVTLASKL